MLNNLKKNGDPADAGPGGWNDPDMLETGNGYQQTNEYRAAVCCKFTFFHFF